MYNIYKITKPNEMKIYIGKTKESLKIRFSKHKHDSKRYPDRLIYQWLDNSCDIELIENYNGNESSIREMEIIQDYINNGYEVLNEKIGKHILDPINNSKNLHKKDYSNANREYYTWSTRISRAAKKEGLNSKEYKLKHNIPEFSGDKKRNKI